MCSRGHQRLICAVGSVDPDVRRAKPLAAESAAYGTSHCSLWHIDYEVDEPHCVEVRWFLTTSGLVMCG
jgi:hypothetical protein